MLLPSELQKTAYDKSVRLQFIELLLRIRGWLTRKDLIKEFGVSPAAATRDIAAYSSMAVANIEFDGPSKRYIKGGGFKPLGELSTAKVGSILRRASKTGTLGAEKAVTIETPLRLSMPSLDVFESISRSIANGTCLEIDYCSTLSGYTTRTVRPHAFFDTGLHWYVRVFCFKKGFFIDLLITRIARVVSEVVNDSKESNSINDDQWQRWVELVLAPHPSSSDSESIERGFQMEKGFREIRVRAALAGYWLSLWHVDCSDDFSIGKNFKQYQLCLKNKGALYGVKSAYLAPGYKAVDVI